MGGVAEIIRASAVRDVLQRQGMQPLGTESLQHLAHRKRVLYIVDDFLKNSRAFTAGAPDLIRLDGKFTATGLYSRAGATGRHDYRRIGDIGLLLEDTAYFTDKDFCIKVEHTGVQYRFTWERDRWRLTSDPLSRPRSAEYWTPSNVFSLDVKLLGPKTPRQ